MNMREIKFRAKRKLNGDWVYGSLVESDEEDWDCIITEYSGDLIDCDNIRVITNTIGQFTGLKDKNGKEIYEGDIIQDDNYKFVVVWGEHTNKADLDIDIYIVGFLRKWKDGTLSPLGYYRGFQGQVIGNIYEHPELLKTL